jgi:hypothetical protein
MSLPGRLRGVWKSQTAFLSGLHSAGWGGYNFILLNAHFAVRLALPDKATDHAKQEGLRGPKSVFCVAWHKEQFGRRRVSAELVSRARVTPNFEHLEAILEDT